MGRYLELSQKLLQEAEISLSQGDYIQASEKLWGASTQLVKAIAEKRGWRHDGYADLFSAVSRLVDETGDETISSLFRIADQLHANFYENWLPLEEVIRASKEVERLIEKLSALL